MDIKQTMVLETLLKGSFFVYIIAVNNYEHTPPNIMNSFISNTFIFNENVNTDETTRNKKPAIYG